MKISGSSRASEYAITFQFNQNLPFENDKYYEFEFSFLFNNAECEKEDLEMVVFLRDLAYFKETLYRMNTSDESILHDKWNKARSCFKVLGRNYRLQTYTNSSCNIRGNKEFIAIDNIILREISGDNLDEICKDIRVTEYPDVIVVTTIDTTEGLYLTSFHVSDRTEI